MMTIWETVPSSGALYMKQIHSQQTSSPRRNQPLSSNKVIYSTYTSNSCEFSSFQNTQITRRLATNNTVDYLFCYLLCCCLNTTSFKLTLIPLLLYHLKLLGERYGDGSAGTGACHTSVETGVLTPRGHGGHLGTPHLETG